MITKGIIQNINYLDNTCTVRMPLFESAGYDEQAIATAIFSVTPGIYNSYAINDIVLVGFEVNKINLPVILGKLYLGTTEEKELQRGAANLTNLTVSTSASLPINTEIIAQEQEENIATFLSEFNTLEKIITKIKDNSIELDTLKNQLDFSASEKCIGEWLDETPLFRLTIIYTGMPQLITNSNEYLLALPLPDDFVCIDAWIDYAHTAQISDKYSLGIYSGQDDYFNVYINLNTKQVICTGKLKADQQTIKKHIITIEYTKA